MCEVSAVLGLPGWREGRVTLVGATRSYTTSVWGTDKVPGPGTGQDGSAARTARTSPCARGSAVTVLRKPFVT